MLRIKSIWNEIYGGMDTKLDEKALEKRIDAFIEELESIKDRRKRTNKVHNVEHNEDITWYKDAVIYSTYADLFNKNIQGLKDKLDYLKELGVNCLWLLPILKSPMKDAGFDISDYETIREDLLGLDESGTEEEKEQVFIDFIDAAHARGIRVIFDIAMNHCSVEHPWFKEARVSKDSLKRDYFIWSDTTNLYREARIIFKGMCESNWEMEEVSGQYYFHRFFDIQPDLNYRNPEVLLSMTQVLINWKQKGIDGFRADAVPYIWKEENTICENLPKTHLVVQFFRAVLDYLEPGTLLLAEACQPPQEVVEYFGDNNECNAAYHFPVMPRIYKALAQESRNSIEMVLEPSFTPDIPKDCQWFMFLRCHDELTLEMVTPEEREFIYNYYVKDPKWDFRRGEGISSRLAELFSFNPDRIALAYSIMFTLLGTPIVYYGDEFAKANDEAFYDKIVKETGYPDSRYLARGPIDWAEVDKILADETSVGYQVFHKTKQMIHVRGEHKAFARGSLTFVDVNEHILAYERWYEGDRVLVLQNLSSVHQEINQDDLCDEYAIIMNKTVDLLGQHITKKGDCIIMNPYEYLWL